MFPMPLNAGVEAVEWREGRRGFEDSCYDTFIKNLSVGRNERRMSCIYSTVTLNDILVQGKHVEDYLG